jgi:hypothetical protein
MFYSKIAMAIVAVAIAALFILIIVVMPASSAPKKPDIKIIDYDQGDVTLKQGESLKVHFRVKNNENYDLSNLVVKTTFNGETKYFQVIQAESPVTPSIIGANGGTSALQTLTIIGNLGTQPDIGADFTISLYFGADKTDEKKFHVSLIR